MFISSLLRRLNDVSISKKLYFTISIIAFLVVIELCTLWFSITTLSAVRSYVGGEGLWSKAQKDAVMNLREYAHSHDEKHYQAFKSFLQVPFGDKMARVELEKLHPDFNVAKQGFLQGRNHPDDIDGMMKLVRRFSHISYLNKAFSAWAQAEPTLQEMIVVGDQLHDMVQANAKKEDIAPLLAEIERINLRITELEDNFSFTLGEGARWLEDLVLTLVLTLSLTIGVTSIVIAISINRSLKKGLDAISKGAELIRKGALETRVKVYSKDEVGVLAMAFNEMTDTLEQKIAELKLTEESLICAKERAEYSEKAKQHFLINMSHEIRTPMNAILGFSRYLQESLKEKEQLESIRMIIKSGDHLLVTLNDILDFSNIETGEVSFMKLPFNLRDTVQSIHMLMDSSAKLKKIGLSYSIDDNIPDAVIYGDSVRLTQILLSLTSNAIKFTEVGYVAISAKAIKDQEESIEIEFSVNDTGIGIPFEKQEKIFELFEQGTSHMARKFGGTGIGLSIVKHLLALQQGEIHVKSVPNGGSEFYFRLAFSKKGLNDNSWDSAHGKDNKLKLLSTSESGKGVKVLIVEDNLINQLLVIKLLQKRGYETTVAENGKIALRKYSTSDFDIILMDLQMPEMDGYETTIHIRNLKSYKKNVPIVAMTAHTIKGELEKCLAIGMNDYISKPFQADELYEKIRLLVGVPVSIK